MASGKDPSGGAPPLNHRFTPEEEPQLKQCNGSPTMHANRVAEGGMEEDQAGGSGAWARKKLRSARKKLRSAGPVTNEVREEQRRNGPAALASTGAGACEVPESHELNPALIAKEFHLDIQRKLGEKKWKKYQYLLSVTANGKGHDTPYQILKDMFAGENCNELLGTLNMFLPDKHKVPSRTLPGRHEMLVQPRPPIAQVDSDAHDDQPLVSFDQPCDDALVQPAFNNVDASEETAADPGTGTSPGTAIAVGSPEVVEHVEQKAADEVQEQKADGEGGNGGDDICGRCGGRYKDTQFWIQCEVTCMKWFHGKCVGMTSRKADSINEFSCPPCLEQLNKKQGKPGPRRLRR